MVAVQSSQAAWSMPGPAVCSTWSQLESVTTASRATFSTMCRSAKSQKGCPGELHMKALGMLCCAISPTLLGSECPIFAQGDGQVPQQGVQRFQGLKVQVCIAACSSSTP